MTILYLLGGTAVMALITYLVRMIPLVFIRRRITNRFILSVLYYIPYSVLSAMTFPAILYATGHLISGLCALVVGAFFAFRKRASLLVVSVMACIGALIPELIYFFFFPNL